MAILRNFIVLTSLIILLSGCSSTTTRMMVSQKGSDKILVIDLDPTSIISNKSLSLTPPFDPESSLRVDIHPLGGTGYVTRFMVTSYMLNLTSGNVMSTWGNSIDNKNLFLLTPSGGIIVTAEFKDVISAYNALDKQNATLLSSVSLTDRIIKDITICNDNTTVLVTSSSTTITPYTSFITRMTLTNTGTLNNPGQELSYPDRNILQIACSASSKAGAALDNMTDSVVSFTIDATTGLQKAGVNNVVVNGPPIKGLNALQPIPQALIFNPAGNELFIRISSGGNSFSPQGWIEKFRFDKNTGTMTPGVMTPNNTPWLATAPQTSKGSEGARMSMHPDGGFIYIPDTDAAKISVINTVDGSQAPAITDATITAPTFISIGEYGEFGK